MEGVLIKLLKTLEARVLSIALKLSDDTRLSLLSVNFKAVLFEALH